MELLFQMCYCDDVHSTEEHRVLAHEVARSQLAAGKLAIGLDVALLLPHLEPLNNSTNRYPQAGHPRFSLTWQ